MPQSQTAEKPMAPEEKPHNNHKTQGDKQRKATRNVQQNIEQLQTPTIGAITINSESTTTEPPP